MALLSPGVQVSVIDQTNYTPAPSSSVPFILLATAQNKISGAGTGIAPGTLAANANKVYLMTSQRDLLSTYGVPFFYNTTAGTPINGYELNEYGLLAAYSALGVSNQCYVQRVDIDLAALTASLTRPTGSPANGTYWLDTTNSVWGINQWNQTTGAFTKQTPLVITDTADLEISSTVPLQTYGSIGDYAVVTTNTHTPIYYKRGGPTDTQAPTWSQDSATASDLYNTWVQVGSDYWKTSWPTVQGTAAPVSLVEGDAIDINGVIIPIAASPNNNVQHLVNQINGLSNSTLPGVYAANIGGKLALYADSGATNDGSTEGTGVIAISNSVGTPLTTLGIVSNQYAAPAYAVGTNYEAPRWRTTDTQPEPTGSVFQQTNSVNQGINLIVKKYSSTLGTFVTQNCPVFQFENEANYTLDPASGGLNIPAGSTYARIIPENNKQASIELLERYTTGPTIISGSNTTQTFVVNNTFNIQATEPGTSTITTGTARLLGTTASDFVAAVSAAQVPNVSASVNSSGAIVFTHSTGGSIYLTNLTGTPVTAAGFTTNTPFVRPLYAAGQTVGVILSNWVSSPVFAYTASNVAPGQDPASGTYWYYSDATTADIMIQNNGAWMGYQMVTNDVRGYNLTLTNATGPIFSAIAPTTQTNTALSPLVYGDLWINTSDLENYPLLSRWESVNGVDQWVAINNADQTTTNGILFADARWAPDGTTNPVSDPIPTITSLLVSDYLDLDAPNPAFYPQGTLLWNTRRSGFNVKQFEYNYFNSATFPDSILPSQTSTWVTASGNRADGSPYMGRQAQRAIIVKALKSGIDSNTQLRENQAQFNLLACPQYPELAPNMVVLNNDRGDTGFTIVDTPLRLTPDEVVTWATNNNALGLVTGDGNLSSDAYSAAFYPSCTTNDLSGNIVATAPSHMMIRTIIRSDSVSYPWFAPAGLRRGVVDNATQIGYVNSTTGEFQTLGVNQGLRDTLYSNNVNPITFIPGTGITNFGNHTLQGSATALNRINVARLVAYLRGRLEIIGNQYLFEPNDTITRQSITNQITSLMTDLVNKRGLYDYLVVCDLTNNTPATIDANELFVDIAIEPVKAVEFIYIPMRIQNTGTIQAQQAA
jgi:Phage tail sheath C-terminal domain